MIAAKYDLICEQGSTFAVTLFRKQSDGVTAVPLSGYTARMHVRQSPRFNTPLLTMTTANSQILLSITPGQIDLRLTPAVTAALPAGAYVYDLELEDGGGIVTKILRGAFTVRAEVTR